MSHLEVPRFPRGFLLSERPIDAPFTFVPGPVLPHFWVHPWTRVEHAGDRELFVIILGHCLPTRADQVGPPAEALLGALRRSDTAFFQAVNEYGGRHAIIFGSVGNVAILNDASAMRSVFYAAGRGVVASHALLVEKALGGRIVRDELPFQYGYPGNRTPYARTRVLTANTYYWITAKLVRRFWPFAPIVPTSVEDAAQVLLDASTVSTRAMAASRHVKLTLTAGLDSRATLALAQYAGVEFDSYTYVNVASHEVDRGIAVEIAARYGLPHTVLDVPTMDDTVLARLDEVNYRTHHAQWVDTLMRYFPDGPSMVILGNALEIGRSNSMGVRKYRTFRPVSAEAMSLLYYRRMGVGTKQLVKDYGRERYMEQVRGMFELFMQETSYDLVVDWFNPFDLFYWEHRMSTWQGLAMNERDFYTESFIPYNSRRVYETMLGVPEEQRYADETVYRMIEMVNPGLRDWPVNPKSWGSETALVQP